jgi:hypothetical protein
MSRGALGNLERGDVQNPPLGTLLRLMAALDLPSIEMLLGATESPSRAMARLLLADDAA